MSTDAEHYLGLAVSKLDDLSENIRRMQDCITSPCFAFKPKLSIDGNQFCFLLGDDLQSGLAGFGDTPAKAAADFDKNFLSYDMSGHK